MKSYYQQFGADPASQRTRAPFKSSGSRFLGRTPWEYTKDKEPLKGSDAYLGARLR